MENSIVILGLPDSGKTTYLAALWHLITSQDLDTTLRFSTLRGGDHSHLNALADLWVRGQTQDHTPSGSSQFVSMNLLDTDNNSVLLTFPDLSGESYRQMWEDRDCSPIVSNLVQTGTGILLFIHADNIVHPQWVVDVTDLSEKAGLAPGEDEEVAWKARLAPTQVQIVDMLQLLRLSPLNAGTKKIAIMLSAWDKVSEEGRTPEAFFTEHLPLLDQYLRHGFDGWDWHIYGLSAQGGDYETKNKPFSTNQRERFDALMLESIPSRRISLVSSTGTSNDLTEPLVWLMS